MEKLQKGTDTIIYEQFTRDTHKNKQRAPCYINKKKL